MNQPPSPRTTFLGLSIIGVLLALLLAVQARMSARVAEGYLPQLDAVMEMELALADFEASYEGLVHGDHPHDRQAVLTRLARAEKLARDLLAGHAGRGRRSWVGRVMPVRPSLSPSAGQQLRAAVAELAELRGLVDACVVDAERCADSRMQVELLSESLRDRGVQLEAILRRSLEHERARAWMVRASAFLAAFLLAVGVGGVFARWERAWHRAFDTIRTYTDRLNEEIDQRREVESVLRESEARFRVMADDAPVLMWMTDHDLQFVFVNRTWLDFVGRPLDSQLGRGWMMAVHPDDRERVEQALRASGSARSLFQIELRIQRHDGVYRWLVARGVPRFEGSGSFVGFIGSCLDITDRRQAEDRLRDSEGRFRAMTEAAYDPVLLVDDRGRITHWNAAATQVFGHDETQVIGRSFLDRLVPPDAADEVAELFERVRRQAATGSGGEAAEVRLRHRDGREIPVDLSLAGVMLGGRPHAVLIARDATERRRREQVESLLRRVSEGLIEGERVEKLMGEVCRTLRALFDLDVVWIGLPSEDGPCAVVARADGEGVVAPAGASVLADGVIRAALDSGELQVGFRDPEGEGLAVLAAPLGTEGLLVAEVADPDVLDRSVSRHLQPVARQLGVALARARDQRELRLHGTALAAVANAVYITDENGVIRWVNEAFCKLSEYAEDEVLGRTPGILNSGHHPAPFFATLWETIRAGHTWVGEVVERRKSGSTYTVSQTVTPLRDEFSGETLYIAVQTDITAQREVEQKLRHLALHDELTGLANRVLFARHLKRAISGLERSGDGFAVLFMDLDNFKDINDTLGHPAGDLLLKEVAARLENAVRPADTVARFGGDEFAILQTDVHRANDVATLARKLIHTLEQPVNLGGHVIHTAASIGVAAYTVSAPARPEDILSHADTALYKAKADGRGTFRFHTERLQEEVVRRVELTAELRRALEHDELRVFYQPQVELETGRIVGMEALVRWQHPERGLVLPGRFIAVAEESGLIVQLGENVLREVCRTVAAWHASGICDVPVAVNLSAVQFRSADLAERVKAILAETGLPPGLLELELTESILMRGTDRIQGILRTLHAEGVRFSIDDFGTGYSSLQYLRTFPIHKLKIAQEFVRELADEDPSGSDAAIVAAVVGLSHSLGLRSIAEGVETPEQVRFLKRVGCQEAQGYYYFRPITAEAMARVLVENRRGDRPALGPAH